MTADPPAHTAAAPPTAAEHGAPPGSAAAAGCARTARTTTHRPRGHDDDPDHDHDDPDLPDDPDLDDVPPDLAALDGSQVTLTEPDGTTTTATLVVAPGLWGHARRFRDGFYDDGPGAA